MFSLFLTALTFGGYFDPRYKGYGHEHVDHTRRLVRVGYGGTEQIVDGQEQVRYFLLKGDLNVVSCRSHFDQKQVDYNYQVASQSMGEQHHRVPWRDDIQLRQFRSETESAMSEGAERAIISDYADPGERGTAFGWYHLMVGIAAIPAGLLFGSIWHFLF